MNRMNSKALWMVAGTALVATLVGCQRTDSTTTPDNRTSGSAKGNSTTDSGTSSGGTGSTSMTGSGGTGGSAMSASGAASGASGTN
jgi:hypothetical protein